MTRFEVEEQQEDRNVPGPRSRQSIWGRFADGAAPPAAQRSVGGTGTRKYYGRLSEAAGIIAGNLVASVERSPMVVYDFMGGCQFTAAYTSTPKLEPGRGTVYVLEDGFGIKIGYTSDPVAKTRARPADGNSRNITQIADILDSTPGVQAKLHSVLNDGTSRVSGSRATVLTTRTGSTYGTRAAGTRADLGWSSLYGEVGFSGSVVGVAT